MSTLIRLVFLVHSCYPGSNVLWRQQYLAYHDPATNLPRDRSIQSHAAALAYGECAKGNLT